MIVLPSPVDWELGRKTSISRNGTDSLSTVVNGGGTPNNFTCVDGTQIARVVVIYNTTQ